MAYIPTGYPIPAWHTPVPGEVGRALPVGPYAGWTKDGKPLGPDGKVIKATKNAPYATDPYWFGRVFDRNGDPIDLNSGRKFKAGRPIKGYNRVDPLDPNGYSYGFTPYHRPAEYTSPAVPFYAPQQYVASAPVTYGAPAVAGAYGAPVSYFA